LVIARRACHMSGCTCHRRPDGSKERVIWIRSRQCLVSEESPSVQTTSCPESPSYRQLEARPKTSRLGSFSSLISTRSLSSLRASTNERKFM
ncbi:hypothetical protein KCV03_g33, partial [Aureobasidium melanogenum]